MSRLSAAGGAAQKACGGPMTRIWNDSGDFPGTSIAGCTAQEAASPMAGTRIDPSTGCTAREAISR